MKLRLQHNSVRLRLKQNEVAQLVKTGRLEESVVFGTKDGETLTFALETMDSEMAPHARFAPGSIVVRVSAQAARHWAETAQVGIEEHQPVSDQHCLHLLIEKDFACLDGSDEQNADTFPHPLSGTKC